MKKRMKSRDAWANNSILLGDFNVFSIQDESFQALEKEQFHIPAKLRGTYTNAVQDRPFDQIAFLAKDVEKQLGLAQAGTFPFFNVVYRDADWQTYQPTMTLNEYKQWRTYKMSDHCRSGSSYTWTSAMPTSRAEWHRLPVEEAE
jgi:hypothetical protein